MTRLPSCLVRAMVVAALLIAAAPAQAQTAFVGMQVQDISPAVAASLGLNELHGVLVRDVALGGPGDKAGFRRGDLIIRFGGKEIDKLDTLVAVVGGLKPGQEASATVLRRGVRVDLGLAATEMPQAWRPGRDAFAVLPENGLTVAAITDKIRQNLGLKWGTVGVVVTLVDGTKVENTDLERGDVIVQINQHDVWTPDHVTEMYRKAKEEGRQSLLLLVEGTKGFRFTLLKVH